MDVRLDEVFGVRLEDVVDLVATNLASFSDRVSPGGTFSAPFLYERRALRIRAADRSRYSTIGDFVGKRVGAVTGMAAHRDLLARAPEGVQVVAAATFPELYAQFDNGGLEAIAQAEYFMLDGRNSADLSNMIGAGNPNKAALPFIKPEIKSIGAIFPDDAAARRLEQLKDMTSQQRRAINRIWTEIKAK